MKHLFRAATIKEMWFDTPQERERYIAKLRDPFKVIDKSDFDGEYYLTVAVAYNNTPFPLILDYKVSADESI